jgi:hypothetical protein
MLIRSYSVAYFVNRTKSGNEVTDQEMPKSSEEKVKSLELI